MSAEHQHYHEHGYSTSEVEVARFLNQARMHIQHLLERKLPSQVIAVAVEEWLLKSRFRGKIITSHTAPFNVSVVIDNTQYSLFVDTENLAHKTYTHDNF